MNHSSDPTGAAVSSAGVDSADRMFVVMMIPHHQQAIEMSDTLLAKDGIEARVRALALQIKDAQGPEIEKMKSWLQDWGTAQSTPMTSGGAGDRGDGMMSGTDMTALSSASGKAASKLYLQQMIVHHRGAIAMAKSVLDNGENSGVATLARRIVAGQTAEIATMQQILGTL